MKRLVLGALQGSFLQRFNLRLPEIVAALPTDLPVLEVRGQRTDLLFLLADGTILHLEFQTTSTDEDIGRFASYNLAVHLQYGHPVYTVVVYVIHRRMMYHASRDCVIDVAPGARVRQLAPEREAAHGPCAGGDGHGAWCTVPSAEDTVFRVKPLPDHLGRSAGSQLHLAVQRAGSSERLPVAGHRAGLFCCSDEPAGETGAAGTRQRPVSPAGETDMLAREDSCSL